MSSSYPDWDEVLIDGWRFKLASPLQPVAVDRLPGKVTTGDYSIDSNDLLSAWVISDLTGGHGVADLKEGVDDTRYHFGDIYTRYPGQWTKPFQIANTNVSTGAFYPLGEMYYSGDFKFYAVGGTDLYEDLVDTTTNITGTPSSKGVAFRGTAAANYFFIPQGNNGYSVYLPGTGLTNNNGGGDPDFQAFCVWDDKLIGIDNTGQMHYTVTAAGTPTWTSYGTGGKLDSSFEPKSLIVYYNRQGESAVHIITDTNVQAFDANTPRIYPIPDFDSQHPYMGVAAAAWQGNLYVAAGMDVMEYNGSVVRRSIGLSRDDGLPFQYQGYVRDLVAGQNSLYAFVRGQTISGTTYYSVHEYSGIGWHTVFLGSDAAKTPTRMVVTRADSLYRLYWGLSSSGTYFYQSLPVNFTNPREAIAATGYNFGWNGKGNSSDPYYLETGKFNGNMKGYVKIANAVEVDVRTLPSGHTVVIKYRVNNDTSWTTLGTVSTTGHNVLQFGTLADGIYPGEDFEDIEFRVELIDPDRAQYTPVVESIVFSFLKIMNPSWSWTCQLDLTASHANQSPENMLAKIIELKNAARFFPMVHRDTTYRVRFAQVGGAEEVGQDFRGKYTLNILEIPTKLGVPS